MRDFCHPDIAKNRVWSVVVKPERSRVAQVQRSKAWTIPTRPLAPVPKSHFGRIKPQSRASSDNFQDCQVTLAPGPDPGEIERKNYFGTKTNCGRVASSRTRVR